MLSARRMLETHQPRKAVLGDDTADVVAIGRGEVERNGDTDALPVEHEVGRLELGTVLDELERRSRVESDARFGRRALAETVAARSGQFRASKAHPRSEVVSHLYL